MDYLFEKVAYLKGLTEGIELENDSKEKKLFTALIDVIEEMAEAIEALDDEQEEIGEYLELMDEDLSTVEEEMFGDFEIDSSDLLEDDLDVDLIEE